jgi:hypothetical protein
VTVADAGYLPATGSILPDERPIDVSFATQFEHSMKQALE